MGVSEGNDAFAEYAWEHAGQPGGPCPRHRPEAMGWLQAQGPRC